MPDSVEEMAVVAIPLKDSKDSKASREETVPFTSRPPVTKERSIPRTYLMPSSVVEMPLGVATVARGRAPTSK